MRLLKLFQPHRRMVVIFFGISIGLFTGNDIMARHNTGFVDGLTRPVHDCDHARHAGSRVPPHCDPFPHGKDAPPDLQRVNPVVLSSIAVPLAIFITVTNAIAVGVTLRNRRLRKLRNMPLVSLALADLMVGLLVVPMFVIAHLTHPNRTFCASYLFFETLCYTASLTSMLVVAIERSITIFKPLRHTRYLTPCLVWGMITSAWVLSFLVAISLPGNRSKCEHCYCVEIADVHSMFLAVFFVVLSIIMVAMQLKMYIVVVSHRRRIVPSKFRDSFGELTTTIGATVTRDRTHNYDSDVETQRRELRNGNANMKVETLTLALVHTQNEARDPSVIARFLITKRCNEGEGVADSSSSRNELVLQNQNLRMEEISADTPGDVYTRRNPTSQIYTICQSSEHVIGVRLEKDAKPSRSHGSKSDYALTRFASFMYLAFILTWTPYLIVLLMKNFGCKKKSYLIATVSTKLLVVFNSLVNPFVHTIRMQEFRKFCKAYFCRKSNE